MESFFPEDENYTRTWGPLAESAGVTLVLGSFILLGAHRVWPDGLNEILLVFLSPEFLWEPTLFLALAGVSLVPSIIWLVLHPLIDARRIDRNPVLQRHITRNYSLLFKQIIALHAIAFTASAAVGMFLLNSVASQFRMPLAFAVYGVVHGALHFVINRFGTRFSRLSLLNLETHLYNLLLSDRARFEDTVRLLGCVWAFHHGMANRLGPILQGTDRVPPNELLHDLDFVVHEFPPQEGLESMLKVGAPDRLTEFRPVMNQLRLVLESKAPLSVNVDMDPARLLESAPRDQPLHVLCACLHNYNRSPAMAAALNFLLEQKGLRSKVVVSSGGIVPILRPNQQLLTVLQARGMAAEPHRPKSVSDEGLQRAHLVLAADVPTALALAWRLHELERESAAFGKVILFTSLDRSRFKGQDKLPDPASERISLKESVRQIHSTLEHALLPTLAAATIPAPIIVLAGQLLRGMFPGDLPIYQVEKRMRLLLAVARNDPSYLIRLDRKNYRSNQLPPADVSFIWDENRAFREMFLAQLCVRFPERDRIRRKSPYGKDYVNSVAAMASLLSPVVHRISHGTKQPVLP